MDQTLQARAQHRNISTDKKYCLRVYCLCVCVCDFSDNLPENMSQIQIYFELNWSIASGCAKAFQLKKNNWFPEFDSNKVSRLTLWWKFHEILYNNHISYAHSVFFLARAVRMKIRLLPIYISEIGLGVGRRFLSHFHPYRFQFSTHKRSVWQRWRCVFASDWKLHCFLHIIIALIFPPIVIWFGLFSGSSSLLPYRQCSLSLSPPHFQCAEYSVIFRNLLPSCDIYATLHLRP